MDNKQTGILKLKQINESIKQQKNIDKNNSPDEIMIEVRDKNSSNIDNIQQISKDQKNQPEDKKPKKFDQQISGIKSTLTNDMDLASQLRNDMKTCIKREQGFIKIQNKLANAFITMGQKEQLKYLQGSFKLIGQTMLKINEKQKSYKEFINGEIQPSLQGYSAEVKGLKKSLQGYEKLTDKKEKREIIKEKKLNQLLEKEKKLKQKVQQQQEKEKKSEQQKSLEPEGGGLKKENQNQEVLQQQQIQQELVQNKSKVIINDQEKREEQELQNEIRLSGVNLDTNLRLYILNRNAEFKAIMNHIINKKMDFHSYALSQLLALTDQIARYDPSNNIKQNELKEMIGNVFKYEKEMEENQQQMESSQQALQRQNNIEHQENEQQN